MRNPKASKSMNRAKSSFIQQLRRWPSRFAAWLLRCWFWANRSARTSRAGFVLPTTVLLLLMVSLTVGALSFRSFTRVNQTIAFREQQIVDGYAAPAVDRAKAKLEYLFVQDPAVANRRPPSSFELHAAILQDAALGDAHRNADPYTLPDETQLDITGDGNPDPAWSFESGGETIIYSMLTLHEDDDGDPLTAATVTIETDDDATKATNLVTRNGPINTQEPAAGCPIATVSGEGWQDAGSEIQKNIQINVLAIANAGTPNQTVSAAEYQQVRSYPRGNAYGAWFRYDLEIFPGQPFRWNGAMHSESSIISSENLKAYLLSSTGSCIFSDTASDITISESAYDVDNDGTTDATYLGQIVAGRSKDDTLTASNVDFHSPNTTTAAGGYQTPGIVPLTTDDDSIGDGTTPALSDIAVDPVMIFTLDQSQSRDASTWTSTDPTGETEYMGQRVYNLEDINRPFLDDGYRADDRYGPKPVYDNSNSLTQANGVDLATPHRIGEQINDNNNLSGFDAATDEFGLDGFWEKRSIADGLRIIVGQRLELGNAYGFVESEDPLYPPEAGFGPHTTEANGETDGDAGYSVDDDGYLLGTKTTDALASAPGNRVQKGPAETRQQKSLRDNLAAVQSMLVYHYSSNSGLVPYMCMASTVHPGTEQTLINSRTFTEYGYDPATASIDDRKINFLTGEGTNGWEFDFPYTSASFASGQPLGNALRNLANFAGDPNGGAPTFTPVQGTSGSSDEFVHPYPYMSMWGDFSVMRRIFATYTVGSGSVFDSLSPADKSTLQSAACTLGMLAYNLESLETEYNEIVGTPTRLAAVESDLNAATADVNTRASIRAGAGLSPTSPQAQDWIEELKEDGAASLEDAKVMALYLQTIRDRELGFATGAASTCPTTPATVVSAFCSSNQIAAYPALYYIFPTSSHNQTAGQPSTEEYIGDTYISTQNTSVTYQVVDPADIDLDPADDVADGTGTDNFLQPTATPGGNLTGRDALQQNLIDADGTVYSLAFLDKAMMDGRELVSVRVLDVDIDKLTANLSFDSGAVAWIPEDEGIVYAFREDAVREDSIVRPAVGDWATCQDFNELTTNADCYMDIVPTAGNQAGTYDPPLNADNSISPKPVDMYADPDRRPHGFRLINGEDLNRSGNDAAAGVTFVTDNPAYVYGNFNLHRDSAGNIIEEFNTRLEDENFNNPATDEADAIEAFYDRARADLNPNFARGATDSWRPSEIFADAVSILSDSFRDGWIDEAFTQITNDRNDDYDAASTDLGDPVVDSSYLNYNRPMMGTEKNPFAWRREDRSPIVGETFSADIPILFDRNGVVYKSQTENNPSAPADATAYLSFPTNFSGDHASFYRDYFENRRKMNQIAATAPTRVNALLVAGIVPMRSGQNYGGLHNFPRLQEFWRDSSLVISGGFYQLNFSTQSTAPFDQDAWEPGGTTSQTNVVNDFYVPATRIWGYDVGFQYTSTSPIASRFVSIGRPRSEYYRELPLDDAYVQQLCTAVGDGGTRAINVDCS